MTDIQKLYALRKWLEKQDLYLKEKEHQNLGTDENYAKYYFAGDDYFYFYLKDCEFGTNSLSVRIEFITEYIEDLSDFNLDKKIREFKKLVIVPSEEEIKAKKEEAKAKKLEKIKQLKKQIADLK